MNKSTPILVLGSNSFSGSSFIDQLLSEGLNVIGVSRSRELITPFRTYSDKVSSQNFVFKQIDVNNSPESIAEIVREFRVEYVFNFIAQSMVSESWISPEHWYQTNIVSISKLCNLLLKIKTIKKFVQFTTPEVYGSTNGLMHENFDFAPSTPYAISRAAGDWHLKSLFLNYGFPVIFTRASNVYGSGQDLYRIIPRAILLALTGQKLPLHGGGKSLRSFIHIRDVSSALMAILEDGRTGDSYHISTNEMISIHDLVKNIAHLLNVDLGDLIYQAEERPGKDFTYQLSSEKIRKELGWEDQISLTTGLESTVKWVKLNLETLKSLPTTYEHKQ